MSRSLLNFILMTSRFIPHKSIVNAPFCAKHATTWSRFILAGINKFNAINYSSSASLVLNKDDEKLFVDLYKDLRTYNADQVLDLMTVQRKQNLDPTHLAICMKRMHSSYMEASDKKSFIENIKSDPRFMKLISQLMISARHLTPPIICEMVKFAQVLDCPLPYQYGLLKLCTNAISDVAMDKLAELSEVLSDSLEALEEKIKHGTLAQNDYEWLPLLSNQIELLFKCMSLLATSKGHQLPILDMKKRIDVLLAFGTHIPTLKRLLADVHKHFEEFNKAPNELIRLIPSMLFCLSSFAEDQNSAQKVPLWISTRISGFKDLLTSIDESMADKLLKEILVEDRYDELTEGFEPTLHRMKNNDNGQNTGECARQSRRLLDMAFTAFYESEKPIPLDKKSARLLLGACITFSKAKPYSYISRNCIYLSKLVSDKIHEDLVSDLQNELWTIPDLLDVLADLGNVGYFSRYLSSATVGKIMGDENSSKEVIKEKLHPLLSMITGEQMTVLLDTFSMPGLEESSDSPATSSLMEVLLDHVEDGTQRFFSNKTCLDVRMRLACHLYINERHVDSELIESLLEDVKSNATELRTNAVLQDVSKAFLRCFADATMSSHGRRLWSKMHNELQNVTDYGPGKKAINALWSGKVKTSPSGYYGYLIDLPSSDGLDSKRVMVNFYSNNCFWKNTLQLRPIWFHVEKNLQRQGYNVVPVDLGKFSKKADADIYLKYRVEKSHEFQDPLQVA